MKVGDLIRCTHPQYTNRFFLVARMKLTSSGNKKIWIYPDFDNGYSYTDDLNYYYGQDFEVVSESR